jgi:hypothetical protein
MDGTGVGTVDPLVGSYTYNCGETVDLLATPDAGSTFGGWSGDITDPNQSSSIIMNGDKTVTATFDLANILNYLLVQGFNGNSGACTGLQETHEETSPPPIPQLIDPGISWLYMKNQATPNIKWINFIARYDNSSTTIEYKYQYRLHYELTGVTTGWLLGHDWTSPAVGSLADDGTYGYGFVSGCMDAPSSPSEKYYCCEFEIQIRVNGDNSNIYTVHID